MTQPLGLRTQGLDGSVGVSRTALALPDRNSMETATCGTRRKYRATSSVLWVWSFASMVYVRARSEFSVEARRAAIASEPAVALRDSVPRGPGFDGWWATRRRFLRKLRVWSERIDRSVRVMVGSTHLPGPDAFKPAPSPVWYVRAGAGLWARARSLWHEREQCAVTVASRLCLESLA